MKNDLASRGQIIAAAVLPAVLLFLVCIALLWLGNGWRVDAKGARVQAAHDQHEAAESQKRIDFLKANKFRVDEVWLELSAGAVRVTPGGGVSGFASGGPSVNLADVPMNRGAAASSGLTSGASRPRDLPESLSALSEADFIIIPQPPASDHNFRHYALGSDRIELGRVLPLLASVESRFPLALIEGAVFALPASQEAFVSKPSALEVRLVMRLPIYDATARQAQARAKLKPAAKPAAPASPAP